MDLEFLNVPVKLDLSTFSTLGKDFSLQEIYQEYTEDRSNSDLCLRRNPTKILSPLKVWYTLGRFPSVSTAFEILF